MTISGQQLYDIVSAVQSVSITLIVGFFWGFVCGGITSHNTNRIYSKWWFVGFGFGLLGLLLLITRKNLALSFLIPWIGVLISLISTKKKAKENDSSPPIEN